MSNRTATTYFVKVLPCPYPKHGRGRTAAPMRSPCIYCNICTFFWPTVLRRPRLSHAFSAAAQTRCPTVHYDIYLDTGRALWRCCGHLTSPSRHSFARGCAPPRSSSGAGEWKTPHFIFRADHRKRYTATIPHHRAVKQNTHGFFTPIRDADWSTQPRTGFWHQLLAVHHTAAFQLGRHRFLTRPIPISGGKYTMARFLLFLFFCGAYFLGFSV